MAKDPSLVVTVDFSDVKESSGINPKQQPEADYLMRIIKVEMKKTKEKNEPMALILFQDANMRSAVYPYYCTFSDNMLWKIRNAFIAAGVPVPKSKGKIDLGKLVNKEVGVTLEDDEYDGKMKSVISAVFHKDELEPTDAEEDDFEDDEEEDEEEVEEAPVKKSKKKAPAPVEEEDEEEEAEEEDEEEEEEPAPVVKAPSKRTLARRAEKEAAAKAAAEAEEEDDEDEEEEEAPAPVAKKKAKAKPAPVVEDDEDDDDLDLDDI
jgi:hypothetical protein